MQINYNKSQGVAIIFSLSELKAALSVLKAIYKVHPLDFIGRAVSDIEADMKPKQLPVINYFHICEHCFREIDERDPNSFRMTTRSISGEETSKWVHYRCKPLKPDSTRER